MMPALMLATVIALGSPPPRDGQTAYRAECASCHGVDLRGGTNAPSIRGVGAADVDFWVGTGRMPAAVPWVQVGHRGPQLPQNEIDAIVDYVTSVQPGGENIPLVGTNGDAARGRALFRENCMHCHGVDAEGASIGGKSWAPSLDRASVTQVGEAVRIGPGNMPKFSTAQLSERDLNALVTYVAAHRAESQPVLPMATSGSVPEGLLGWIAAGVMAAAAFAFSRGSGHA
jgi:ubiquinol-cytochrome c reductase cytochrome c subunit